MELPVLEVRRSAGGHVLPDHKVTADERKLFREMESATASLHEDDDRSLCDEAVSAIGAGYGLSPRQSVAFWVRMTFMVFEEP